MIGNDIIDLEQAAKESNWQRPGYLNKIFTPEEQHIINNAADPFIMVWKLWSCKEAAYKIVHRRTRIRSYAPLKFNCSISPGNIIYDNQPYPFKTLQMDNCVHTIAVENEELFNTVEIHTNSSKQWDITKDEDGVPFLFGNPISISHHGLYSGIVILTNSNFINIPQPTI